MAIDRRHFLLGGLASLAPLPAGAAGMNRFLSCARMADGRFCAAIARTDGRILRRIPLPGRGHSPALSPDGKWAAILARRPDRFGLLIDISGTTPPLPFTAPVGRHFYGHAVFSPDGRWLYTTENDFNAARGIIGVWALSENMPPRRFGEFDSGGVGPHEILLMPDGDSLVVANGGIETHPDSGRSKLNIPFMEPSIAYLDRHSGSLLEQVFPPAELHKLSLRHLAVSSEGQVIVGGQYQAKPAPDVPLIATHRRGGPLSFPDWPSRLWRKLNHYVGSVAVDNRGHAAATSPRGGILLTWNLAQPGQAPREIAFDDVCGLAVAGRHDGFIATSGNGHILDSSLQPPSGLQWDNHARALPG